ncbi:hypothetical protein HBN50_11595 [Halobacteriovorax sp. GB3]|uniref:hypothetical protein n=1 Tax=Halobacteriovorax sp. GB3 TaxID=2719615 RepID=UPI0023620850|nr:hypothetical protein [Halobacteriovorax sp. GB3]MDD0853745.1 hypothetical protein [Halobacteriovorax sp. GB3]
MEKDLSEYLCHEDFKTLKHTFVLKNETSGLFIEEYQCIHPGELDKNKICLSLPLNSAREGQKFVIYIFDSKVPKKTIELKMAKNTFQGVFSIFAKVVRTEVDEDSMMAEFSFLEFEESKWRRFIALYKNIQNKVTSISSPISPDYDVELDDAEEEEL